ncbi:MAG: response regulator [Bacillota bacterium]
MNILLVDDEAGVLESLHSALEPAGYDCNMFTMPEKALEAYRKRKYDVVITDVMMREMNGIEVLKRIRTLNPEARVIILTAYVDAETAIAAVNCGAYAFFDKPVEFNRLMSILEKIQCESKEKENERDEHRRLAAEIRAPKKGA